VGGSVATFLQNVTERCQAGTLVPVIERSYPLSEVPEAPRHLGEGRARLMNTDVSSFRLAPMCRTIRILTVGVLILPVVLLATAVFERRLAAPLLVLVAVYAWVWLRFRPTRFVVYPRRLEIVWPLKRRALRRDGISQVRLIEGPDLRSETGWCIRVGAGGLWGGFGWLWTRRRGIVQMYISRTDRFVWIERAHDDRPWLITPEQPEAFVRALSR